ncbi:type II toxin-antitoxin system HicB family antitoxin [Alsobacter sp. SYSU BS001988]
MAQRKGDMTRFVAIVESGQPRQYGAWFPDAPGCVSVGATFDEAIANATQALRLWAEDAMASGEDLPAARDPKTLLGEADVKESITRGAAFAFVPLLVDSGRPARANISLDANLLQMIDAAAKARGLTRSAFLASAAREKILAEA